MALRTLIRLAAVAALFSIAGPSLAVTADAEFDQAVDFSTYKTFAVTEGRITSRTPALNSELTKKRMQSEIEKALIKKGLKLADSAPPDLTVTFQFGSARSMETKSVPTGWRGLGTKVIKVPQAEGNLVIDLHDGANKSLVWRSTAIEGEPNPIKLADKLDDMIKKSIAQYPPKKSKSK